MAFEPYDYASSGIQGMQAGLRTGATIQAVKDAEAERQAQAQANQRQQQFMSAFQGAAQSGDSKALLDVMAAFPEQSETINKMIGARDTMHAKAIGNFAGQLGSLIDSGDINGAMGLVAQNEDVIRAQGRDPAAFIQQLRDNPAAVRQGADAMMLLTMTPEQQMTYRQKLADQDIQRQKMQVQMRGQDITARGQDISASNAALNREIKMAEFQQNQLGRQLQQETNALKQEELRQKLAANEAKLQQAKSDRAAQGEAALTTIDVAIDSLNELATSPGLTSAVGGSSLFPTMPGSKAADFEARLETFKSQTFLPAVQQMKGTGGLSEKEGQTLMAAVGALKSSMSEEAFRKSIDKIMGQLQASRNAAARKFGIQAPPSQIAQPQAAPAAQSAAPVNYQSLWGG